jgi:hypothetical protein
MTETRERYGRQGEEAGEQKKTKKIQRESAL